MKRVQTTAVPDFTKPLSAELLGEAIRAKRTQSKLRLEDAAALCGVAKQTLMNIEHGRSSAQFASILQICAALGIELAIKPWQLDGELNDDWQ